MNLTPPITKKPYNITNNLIHNKLKDLTESKLTEAASNLKALISKQFPEKVKIMDDGTVVYSVAITLDGTWQKRGHCSKHDEVFILSVLTGQVLDYVVKSLFCHQCSNWEHKRGTLEFETWWATHQENCSANYTGSSGGMETSGAVEMFLRSIDKHHLVYGTFVGDGDSSSFGNVKEECKKKYGDIYNVVKEECVGHVQKRLGTGLRTYKLKNRGKMLSDGKPVGGAGRLTDGIIDKMQNNFGFAIRNNVGNKQKMHDAIWAIYNHTIRNDNEPLAAQHRYCPTSEGSWCKFWISQKDPTIKYCQKKRLPEVYLDELLPLFTRLSADQLLDRCLQGLTQNQNEALNGVLWSICPKVRFCGRQKLESSVCEAINRFNAGANCSAELYESLSINPGSNMLQQLLKENVSRIASSDRKVTGNACVHRQKLRSKKKNKIDKNKTSGENYIAGGFGLTSKPEFTLKKRKKRQTKKSIPIEPTEPIEPITLILT